MTSWAIHPNIVTERHVRGMISACIEYSAGQIFVTERAFTLACTHYQSIARDLARRRTRVAARTRQHEGTPARLDELIVNAALAFQEHFVEWLTAEATQADRLWTFTPTTDEAVFITQRLFVGGIARDLEGQRNENEVEMAAQALEAGCLWVTPHNPGILQGASFERWLAEQQTEGRLTNVDVPFAYTVDDAIDHMVETKNGAPPSREVLAGLAWELTRPKSPETARDTKDRISELKRFIDSLHHGGAVRCARALEEAFFRERKDLEKLRSELEQPELQGAVDRTRAAENRQRMAELFVVVFGKPEPPSTAPPPTGSSADRRP